MQPRRPALDLLLFLLRHAAPRVCGMTRENGSGKDQPVEDPDPHMGPVPDKQLHRWKGEGGAMPPEPVPTPEDDNEDDNEDDDDSH